MRSKVMTVRRYVPVLAALTVFGIFGCAAPAPTPTPCSSFTDYDAVFTTSGTGEGYGRAEIRYSGRGYYGQETGTALDGTLLRKAEMVVWDGTMYRRSSTADDPAVYGEWRVAGKDLGAPERLYCAEPRRLPKAPTAAHSTHTIDRGDGPEKYEWWYDSRGRPVRERRTFQPQNGVVYMVNVTYSGHGEPNVFELPVPTPTPWTPPPGPDTLTVEEYAAYCSRVASVMPDIGAGLERGDRDGVVEVFEQAKSVLLEAREISPPAELWDYHQQYTELLELMAYSAVVFLAAMDSEQTDDPEIEDALERTLGALGEVSWELERVNRALDPAVKRVLEEHGC